MHAEPGDWLIVQRAHDARKAKILEVNSADGTPPYLVRWLDDAHIALVFPGPDAHVVRAAELPELDRMENEQLDRMRTAIASRHGQVAGG